MKTQTDNPIIHAGTLYRSGDQLYEVEKDCYSTIVHLLAITGAGEHCRTGDGRLCRVRAWRKKG